MVWYREIFPVVIIGLGGFVFFFFEESSLLFLKSLGITEPRRQDCLHQAQLLFVWSTYSKLTGCLLMQPYTLQTGNG